MFTIKSLIERAIVLGVAASAAACTSSLPPASTSMPLGAAAAPPMAFVDFCERQPGDCGSPSAPELGRMRLAAAAAATRSQTAVASISYDWSAAFAEQRAREAQPSPTSPPANVTAATVTAVSFDWTKVFPQPGAPAPVASRAPDKSVSAATAPMNGKTWSLLERINASVNVAIRPREDMATYGVADYWATPLESGQTYGDCEDYVLEKRHQLIAAGLPASALSIAVVLTDKREPHAVLVVETSTGDYVMDNRTPWILPWAQTGYHWRERQVAGSASEWAIPAVAEPIGQPARFLLASVR